MHSTTTPPSPTTTPLPQPQRGGIARDGSHQERGIGNPSRSLAFPASSWRPLFASAPRCPIPLPRCLRRGRQPLAAAAFRLDPRLNRSPKGARFVFSPSPRRPERLAAKGRTLLPSASPRARRATEGSAVQGKAARPRLNADPPKSGGLAAGSGAGFSPAGRVGRGDLPTALPKNDERSPPAFTNPQLPAPHTRTPPQRGWEGEGPGLQPLHRVDLPSVATTWKYVSGGGGAGHGDSACFYRGGGAARSLARRAGAAPPDTPPPQKKTQQSPQNRWNCASTGEPRTRRGGVGRERGGLTDRGGWGGCVVTAWGPAVTGGERGPRSPVKRA